MSQKIEKSKILWHFDIKNESDKQTVIQTNIIEYFANGSLQVKRYIKYSYVLERMSFIFQMVYPCCCNIVTPDPAVDQGTGASGRRYQSITLTVDGLNWMKMWRPQDAGGCQAMI